MDNEEFNEELGPEGQSLTTGPPNLKRMGNEELDEELNEESDEESESESDDVWDEPDDDNATEEAILEHYDEGREAIKKLVATVSKLRNEVRLWEDEYVNRYCTTDVVRIQNKELQKEAKKWKRECAKAHQARQELEAKLTAFWTSTKLGTTTSTSKDTTLVSEDSPLSGSDSPPSKKQKGITSGGIPDDTPSKKMKATTSGAIPDDALIRLLEGSRSKDL